MIFLFLASKTLRVWKLQFRHQIRTTLKRYNFRRPREATEIITVI